MKQTCCDRSGSETHQEKAAQTLHKIAVVYRNRSPDKISLIKSAGLLNAAMIRNPASTPSIQSDLFELCHHVLLLAKANQLNTNLIQKAVEVKTVLRKRRNEIKHCLKSLLKIPENVTGKKLLQHKSSKVSAIREINKTIANNYISIMMDLCQFCQDLMGNPPCEYAIVEMGFLARENVTLFSNFRHIILLPDNKNYEMFLEYFRWFSVCFHIVVLNLQETAITSLKISSLNDRGSGLGDWFRDAITPKGISLDGLTPLACGNTQLSTELIKPVSEMLKYLGSKTNLKSNCNLANLQTKPCFVFGNKDVFEQFENGAQVYLTEKSKTDTIYETRLQVKNDLNAFSTRFRLSKMKSQETINIKQLVYQSTTTLVTALARIHNISENSLFDTIDKLAKTSKITSHTAASLQYAFATACEIRLRVYAEKGFRYDNDIDLKAYYRIEKFLDIVGVASTINYFQIAYCLQCEVAEQLVISDHHFYSDPQLINIAIGLAFGMRDFASFSPNSKGLLWGSKRFDFDACIDRLEIEIWTNPRLLQKITKKTLRSVPKILKINESFSLEQIPSFADYLKSVEEYEDALEFYKHLLANYQQKSERENVDYDVASINHRIGYCLYYLNQPGEALVYLNRALQIKLNLVDDKEISSSWIASTFNYIGYCHMTLHQFKDALGYLHRARSIRENMCVNADSDLELGWAFHNIGFCHILLHQHELAVKQLSQALEIYQKAKQDSNCDNCFAATSHVLGSFYYYSNKPRQALKYLNQALQIKLKTSTCVDSSMEIAATFYDISLCHIFLQKFDVAVDHLNRALVIYQNSTLGADKESRIAATIRQIRRCRQQM